MLLEANLEIEKLKADSAAQKAQDDVDLLTARFDVRKAELDVQGNELLSAIKARKNELTLEEAKRRLAQLEQDVASRDQIERGGAWRSRSRRGTRRRSPSTRRSACSIMMQLRADDGRRRRGAREPREQLRLLGHDLRRVPRGRQRLEPGVRSPRCSTSRRSSSRRKCPNRSGRASRRARSARGEARLDRRRSSVKAPSRPSAASGAAACSAAAGPDAPVRRRAHAGERAVVAAARA